MGENPTNGGRVTLRDVYDEVRASEKRLMDRIEREQSRADAIHERLDDADTSIDRRVDDLHGRLTVIEDRQTTRSLAQAGIAIVLSAIAAWLGTRQ